MDAMERYFTNLQALLSRVWETQREAMEAAAQALSRATLEGKNIFAFGCSHAGLLAFELYYRTGGMANINPVRAPGMYLDIDPVTMTSEMERMPGYGRIIADNRPIGAGDVVLVHSVSGRNPVPVEFALRCREKGAFVIVLTSVETERSVASRCPDGKKLIDAADLVLDNCGCIGDGSVPVAGIPEKVGPTSTAVGAAMLNAIVCRAAELTAEAGCTPPVFISANVDGGDAHNAAVMEAYQDHIFYMGPAARKQ